MSQSYDVFYWRKFASLAESGSQQLNADVRYLPIADICFALPNVGFGGKADITVDVPPCPLMTQSGHRRRGMKLGIFLPLAPMCGAQIDPLIGVNFDPSAKNATAGKRYCTGAVGFAHRQLYGSQASGSVDLDRFRCRRPRHGKHRPTRITRSGRWRSDRKAVRR
jgi:hypothetical protein